MRILYFAQYFPPEIGAAPQRAYYHAKKWVEMGNEITVITNVPNSPYGKIYKGYRNRINQNEIIDGIHVSRLLTITSGKKSHVIRRFLSSFFYLVISLRALFIKKPDIVLGSAPYFAGISAYICGKLRKIPFIYELRDPWLQVIQRSFSKPSLMISILIKIEKKILKRTEKVVVIGNAMADYIKNEYKLQARPSVIYNGIIKENFENIVKDIPSYINSMMIDKFNVGLIGNLGNQYDFEPIIKAALLLRNKNIQFLFVGEGTQKKYILQKIEELSLENIAVFEAVSYIQSQNILKMCNLSIIPLKKGNLYDIYLPLKLFESLALEVPVLLGNGSEARNILKESNGGFFFKNHKELSEIVKYCMNNSDKCKLKGELGKKYIYKNYERSIMAKKYVKIFKDIMS